MQNRVTCLLLAAVAVVFSGCADFQDVTARQSVGPAPAAPKSRSPGHLVAYTPVELPPISSDTLFYPHSSYALYDRHGVFLQRVRNHLGRWDETPELVTLRPGRYTIRMQSEFGGDLVVPILIRAARTTVVDLGKSHHAAVTALNPG